MEKSYHFIGIGGIGMSSIANILLQKGLKVSGSDIKKSAITNQLEKNGAKIYIGHSENNVNENQIIIYSAAIDKSNPELNIAVKKNLIMIPRAKMLAEIVKDKINIAITGTHGKTTTSSLISKILFDNYYDPTIILGGIPPFLNSNSFFGKGKYAVYEACESYGSLYEYMPNLTLINNLELEHTDYFISLENIIKEFTLYVKRLPSNGFLFFNADDKNLFDITRNIKSTSLVSFGLERESTFSAENILFDKIGTSFNVNYKNQRLGNIISPLFGTHNIYNVLASISLLITLNVSFENIKKSIMSFKNSDRRLQLIYSNDNQKIYSDYAHHPTEINATLKAIKQLHPNEKILTVFQPHLYSRTKEFQTQYSEVLSYSYFVDILPIYAAREQPIKGITSEIIYNKIKDKTNCRLYNSIKDFELFFLSNHKEFDVILFLGAGDIHEIAQQLVSNTKSIL